MCLLPFLISSLAILIYGGSAYASKAICRSKLENALLSAVILSNPTHSEIDADAAKPFFELYLQKNLKLNSSYMPTTQSIIVGPVTYSNYRVIPSGYDDLFNDTVSAPSLEAQITVPVIGGFTINVASRVAIATTH
jgi:hypothetical protein